jgi:hypothetical protein
MRFIETGITTIISCYRRPIVNVIHILSLASDIKGTAGKA